MRLNRRFRVYPGKKKQGKPETTNKGNKSGRNNSNNRARAEKKTGGGRKTGNPIHKTEFKPIKLRKDNDGKDEEADEISREKDTRVLFYGAGEKTTAVRLMQEDVEDGSTRKGRLGHVSPSSLIRKNVTNYNGSINSNKAFSA
ncbi:hypothetical protein RUM43_007102 [Polyplax serrata]|uniref:Uncharacterized protein n=1 Tax=Polyplax serrata TaxID=468196 RepID=A0AAN8Q5N9_POLSC